MEAFGLDKGTADAEKEKKKKSQVERWIETRGGEKLIV